MNTKQPIFNYSYMPEFNRVHTYLYKFAIFPYFFTVKK